MAKTSGLTAPPQTAYSAKDWELLANFWHPVAFESEVGAAPYAFTLLDTDLILYRTDETTIVAALNRCPHRGSKLSLGRMCDSELVCAYHGLRFGAGGKCTHIPSLKKDTGSHARSGLTSFPVQQRYGLVWVCLRPPARFPIFDFPELEDPALQRGKLSLMLNSGAGRHLENFGDTSHFSFIHAVSFGEGGRPDVPPYKVEDTKYGLYYEVMTHQQDGSLSFGEPAFADVPSEYYITYPFTILLRLLFPRGNENILETICPISATTCRVLMVKTRDHDHEQPVDDWITFQEKVNAEDRAIVESQGPAQLPLKIADEFHTAADTSSVAYRRKWRKLGFSGNLL